MKRFNIWNSSLNFLLSLGFMTNLNSGRNIEFLWYTELLFYFYKYRDVTA